MSERKYNMKLNYDLVEETKKKILEIEFFKDIKHIRECQEFEIITNFEDALFYGIEQQDWIDLLENESACFYGEYVSYELQKEIFQISKFDESSVDNMPEKYVSEIGDEVVAALSLCIISRAIMEKTNIFFEMVFKAYCLGGWPCGWKGSKDNGKMLVFYPE